MFSILIFYYNKLIYTCYFKTILILNSLYDIIILGSYLDGIYESSRLIYDVIMEIIFAFYIKLYIYYKIYQLDQYILK